MPIFTPDDLMTGGNPTGHVVIFDDDHYYMGGVMAELLIQKGCSVTLVTPAAYVSEWTLNTLEQHEIHRRLAKMGVTIDLNRGVTAIGKDYVETNCMFTDQPRSIECDAVLLVTSRLENNAVFNDLKAREAEWSDAGIKSVKLIGDANAPGPIAWATYAGHRYARELDEMDIGDALPFRREITELALN
jgi:dimethylamine/trimethylamine dehydrogenase